MNGLSYFSPNYPVHITPLVSVVLIARRVYDCEKCLDTLMKQSTTFETEVIVVDRSSTDEIERLCRRHTSFYPHRLRYRRNPERYIAFGSPGAEVRSRYVIVCRDYERWNDSGKLQRQGEYLREHPSCALCFHNVEGDVSLQHYEERGYEMGDLDFYIYFGIILRFSVWRVLRASILFFYTSGEESFLCIGRSVERCNAFPV